MRNILFVLLLFVSSFAWSQSHDYNLKINPNQDPDSVYILATGVTGEDFVARGRFKSLPIIADLLSPYLGCIDTAFVRNDSLFIYTTDLDSIAFAGGGGGALTDGDKGDITVSGSGSNWQIDSLAVDDNELQLTGVVAGQYDYPAVLKVNSKGRVTEVVAGAAPLDTFAYLATQTDLLSVTDDRSFYDYGTTDMPVTSDDSIETTNVKYILFNGLDGGLNQMIEFLKEGIIRIDQDTNTTARYLFKCKPLQQSQAGNSNFNFGQATYSQSISRNDNVFNIGWNMNSGGGQENINDGLLGISMEDNYYTSGVTQQEWHILQAGFDGVQHRPISMYFDKNNISNRALSFNFSNIYINDDASNGTSFLIKYDPVTRRSTLLFKDPTQINVGMDVGADYDENFAFFNNNGINDGGGNDATLFFQGWRGLWVASLLKYTTEGGAATTLSGRDASEYFTDVSIGYGLSLSSGTLKADSASLATQYDISGFLTSEVDGSITNEIQDLSITGASAPYTLDISGSSNDVNFDKSGIITLTESPANTLVIGATEVDGSTTNELQTFTNSSDATSHTVTLSASGGSVQLVEGSNITLTTTGTAGDGVVTIAASGGGLADGDKGDITVRSSGASWLVDYNAIDTINTDNEGTDATCFPLFVTASGTQSLKAKNNTGLTYNSSTNNLGATTFTGALNGNATTATTSNISGGTLGAIPYQSAANTTTILAADATANKVLMSGASAAPTWSTPTFPNASATSGKIIKSDGTNWVASTETYAAPSTSGNIATSDGTNWTSAANNGGWTTLRVSGSDFTTSSASLVDITGLVTGTLATATLYEFEASLYANSTTTAGLQVGVQQSGTGTGMIGVWSGSGTASASVASAIGSNVLNGASVACVKENADGMIYMKGFVKTGSTGTPTISIKCLKATSGTAKIYIGSVLRYRVAS